MVTKRIEREVLFVELTEKDRQLLALMQKNAREPVASLARQLGVSRTALQERIQKLYATPKEIVTKVNAALVKALDDSGTHQRLLDLGASIPDAAGRTPEALGNLVKSEVARWTPILKAAGAVAAP